MLPNIRHAAIISLRPIELPGSLFGIGLQGKVRYLLLIWTDTLQKFPNIDLNDPALKEQQLYRTAVGPRRNTKEAAGRCGPRIDAPYKRPYPFTIDRQQFDSSRGAVSGRVGKLAQIAKASIESACKSSVEITGTIKPRLAPEALFLLQYQISKSGAVPRPSKGFGKSSVEMTGKKIDRDSLERCYFLLKLVQRRQLALRYVSAVRTFKSLYLLFQFSNEIIINANLFPLLSNSF